MSRQINLMPGSTVPVEDVLANKIDVALIGQASDYHYVRLRGRQSQARLCRYPYLHA